MKEKFSCPYEIFNVLSTCFLTAWCVQKRGRRVDDVGCDAQPSRRNKVIIFQLKIFFNFFLFLLMVYLAREKNQ